MAITLTRRYVANDFKPAPAGDLAVTVYDVAIAAGGNAYPQGGEPIDFSAEFAEVHSVDPGVGLSAPAEGAADQIGAIIPAFIRAVAATASLNTGFLRFYQANGAAAGLANLQELAIAAYPNPINFSITVHGRPSTDAV